MAGILWKTESFCCLVLVVGFLHATVAAPVVDNDDVWVSETVMGKMYSNKLYILFFCVIII